MAQIPKQYLNKPQLVEAVIDARRVQMETEDTAFAIEWLMEHHASFSLDSAKRVLEDETFRYVALYPKGHPGLEAMRAEQRAKGRRAYRLKKLRPQVIDRDDSRCQNCDKRVEGREASLDHKDPEGSETLENIHLLCRRCNTLKGKRTWVEFRKEQEEWEARLKERQLNRPDFVCKQTNLSVRGRSWKEAGCLSPDMCSFMEECDNGGYAVFEREMDEMVESLHAAYDKD